MLELAYCIITIILILFIIITIIIIITITITIIIILVTILLILGVMCDGALFMAEQNLKGRICLTCQSLEEQARLTSTRSTGLLAHTTRQEQTAG